MKVGTWLCVNAQVVTHFNMALVTNPDIIHFDLEDGVRNEHKQATRIALTEILNRDIHKTFALRINSLDTIEGLKDLLWLVDNKIVPPIVILPKANIPDDIKKANKILRPIRPDVQFYVVVETPNTLISLTNLQQKPEGLHGVIFGSADFAAELKVELETTDMTIYKSQLILAARRLGLICIDAPCFNICEESLESELVTLKNFGFDGKIAIHPSQVNPINTALSPTESQVACATKLIESINKNKQQAVVRVGYQMRGPPFLKQAQLIISKTQENK